MDFMDGAHCYSREAEYSDRHKVFPEYKLATNDTFSQGRLLAVVDQYPDSCLLKKSNFYFISERMDNINK